MTPDSVTHLGFWELAKDNCDHDNDSEKVKSPEAKRFFGIEIAIEIDSRPSSRRAAGMTGGLLA